jgi:protein O-mannosyl-transferase
MKTDMSRKQIVLVGLLLAGFIAAGFALNFRGLNAPMYYDTGGLIEGNRALFKTHDVLRVVSIFPQRPLPMVSFAINYMVSGMSAWHFRVWNVVILGFTALMVAVLTYLLLSFKRERSNVSDLELRVVCVFIGFVFLVHPLLTQLVLYIWQRTALMACFFYCCSLASHVTTRTGRIPRQGWGYFLTGVFFLCALLSKENAVTLPLVLIVADAVLFRDGPRSVAKRAAAYLLVAAACISGLSLVERAHGNIANKAGILNAVSQYYAESGLNLFRIVSIQCRVLFDYLSMIVAPTTSKVQLVSPQVVTGPGTESLVPIAGVAALVVAGLIFVRKRPLWGFGIFFFLINLVPESILVPQYAFFGYRAVLPMIGLLIVAADCLMSVLEFTASGTMRGPARVGLACLCAGALAATSSVSLARANLWRDPVLFWQDAVNHFPGDDSRLEHAPASQALHNLGRALQQNGRYEEASVPLKRALRITPERVVTLTTLASVYTRLRKYREAETLLQKAVKLQPDSCRSHRELGDLLAQRGSMDAAFSEFRTALRLDPGDDMVHDAIARAFVAQGRNSEALESFRKALALNEQSYVACTNLSALLMRMNRLDEAAAFAKRALELRPDYWNANQIMGVVLAMTGRTAEAVTYLRRAEKMNPYDPLIKENLATALRQLQDSSEDHGWKR